MKLQQAVSKPFDISVDCLVLGVARSKEGEDGKPVLPQLLKNLAPLLKDSVQSEVFTAKAREKLFLRNAGVGKARHLLLVGLGADKKQFAAQLHDRLNETGESLKAEKVGSVGVFLPSFTHGLDLTSAAFNVGLGFLQSTYQFTEYKFEPAKPALKSVTFLTDRSGDKTKLQKGLDHASKVFEAISLAKDLCNAPPNDLYPEKLVGWAKKATTRYGVKATIFDKAKLEKAGMGGILGVGQGSTHPPRLLVLEYKGPRAKASDKVCLVGKGVTFDTGGISIKPSAKMEDMKYDMGGSAMMIGTTLAAAALKLPIHLITIIPSAENMPSGHATRPGDVLTMYNKKTVEINNTDAEGRLILADALSYAHTFKPNVIVNSATLTGGVVVALGYAAAGLFSNEPALAKQIRSAGEHTGERVWELPLFEDYREDLMSGIADYRNSGNRDASSSKGGTFLHFFIDKNQPWAHIDIAGMAWAASSKPSGNCATGYGVRLMVDFLFNFKPVKKK